jgi:ribonuclease G
VTTKTANCAAESARQIRLRDLSGVIVIDFIDMTDEKAKSEVLDILKKGLRRDRAKNKVYPFTDLGMVEVTRKRMRATIMANFSEPCPFCNGSGRIISKDAVIMRIYRWLVRSEYYIRNKHLRILVHPDLLNHIKNHNEDFISYRDQIEFSEDSAIRVDQFKVFSLPGMEEVTSKYS